MPDVRFKISGNTPTFLAKLYNNAARTTILQQKNVNISGTSVIFGDLPNNTCYYITVQDSIGNMATGTTLTSNTSIGTTTLASRNIYMDGTFFSPNSNTCQLNTSLGNNRIMPSLSVGESVNLVFSVDLKNLTVGGTGNEITNTVSIFCKPNGVTNYHEVCTLHYHNNYAQTLPQIPYHYGDILCYNVSTIASTIPANGYASLSLSSFNTPVGINATIVSPSTQCSCLNLQVTTTTTAPPPPAPIVISFVPEDVNATNWYCNTVRTKVHAIPPLATNQSFRLCYMDCATAYSSGTTPLPVKPIKAKSYGKLGTGANENVASVSLSINSTISDSSYGYVDITPTNINNFYFSADTRSNVCNFGCVHGLLSSVCIDSIGSQVNGTYVIGAVKSIEASIEG